MVLEAVTAEGAITHRLGRRLPSRLLFSSATEKSRLFPSRPSFSLGGDIKSCVRVEL